MVRKIRARGGGEVVVGLAVLLLAASVIAAEPTATPTHEPVVPVWKLGVEVTQGQPVPFAGTLISTDKAVGRLAVPTARYAEELALADDGRRARSGAFAAPGWQRWTYLVLGVVSTGLIMSRDWRVRR